jgi:hypothetical protein
MPIFGFRTVLDSKVGELKEELFVQYLDASYYARPDYRTVRELTENQVKSAIGDIRFRIRLQVKAELRKIQREIRREKYT